MSQSHFTLRFPLKSPADATVLAQELPPLMPNLFRAEDAIGTVHYSRFTVLNDRTLLFLADFDGDFGPLMFDLAKRAGPVFDAIFKHVSDLHVGQGQPGGSNNTHRLIRRGMPYGPIYDPSKPYDGMERGLLGYFINSNIENQYEFVLSQWVNDSEFAGSVRLHPKSKDPIIAAQDPAESIFIISQTNGAPSIKITGLSSFCTTQAAAYCFLPSIMAIKFIAGLQ